MDTEQLEELKGILYNAIPKIEKGIIPIQKINSIMDCDISNAHTTLVYHLRKAIGDIIELKYLLKTK